MKIRRRGCEQLGMKVSTVTATMIGLLSATSISYGQVSTPKTAPVPYGGYYPKDFIGYLLAGNKIPKRDPFETDAQYQKRLPKPWPPGKLAYVWIETPDGKSGFEFVYNADSQYLTIIADGTDAEPDPNWFNTKNGIPDGSILAFRVASLETNSKYYTAENAFGVKKRIEQYSSIEYDLRFVNGSDFPKQNAQGTLCDSGLLKQTVKFFLKTKLAPTSARKLSHHCAIMLAVEPIGFVNTGFSQTDHHTPTIDEPWDVTYFRAHASVKLRRVILWNTDTKKPVTSIEITEKKVQSKPDEVPAQVAPEPGQRHDTP